MSSAKGGFGKGFSAGRKGDGTNMKGYKGGGKGPAPGKGWGKGPRSMSSVDTPSYATMGMDMDWAGQGDWAGWSDVSMMGHAPWQDPWTAGVQADPWQVPRRPGGLSFLGQSKVVVRNRFSQLADMGDDDGDRDRTDDSGQKPSHDSADREAENGDERRQACKCGALIGGGQADQRRAKCPGGSINARMSDLVDVAKKLADAKSSKREKRRARRGEKSEERNLNKVQSDGPTRGDGLLLFDVKNKTGDMQISNVVDYQGWKEIEVTIDSGACDIVMPLSMCSEIPVQESERQRERMEYEVANGETIPNEGERRCLLMTIGAHVPKKIVFQVADVHKALLSITRVADAGYECHLNNVGGYLLDTYTGEKVPITRKGNLYVMKAWVREDRAPAFGRQGR